MDVAAHFRHRRSGQTTRQAGWLLFLVGSLCFVAMQCVGPNRGVTKGAGQGAQGNSRWRRGGQGCCFVGPGEEAMASNTRDHPVCQSSALCWRPN